METVILAMLRRLRRSALSISLSISVLLCGGAAIAQNGHDSILFQNGQSGQLVNWFLSGASEQGIVPLTDPGTPEWQVVGSADLDADQKPDLVFQNRQTGQLVYWLMNGTSLRQVGYMNPSSPGPLYWKAVALADLNGDSHPDILFQNQQTGELVYWMMNGSALVSYGYLAAPGSVIWKVAAAGDLTGDGQADILFQNQQSGQLVYWQMNHTTYVRYGYLTDPGSTDWKVVGIGDFDGDTHRDLLFQNQGTGQLVYWLMNGVDLSAIGYINPDNPGSATWRAAVVWNIPSRQPL
jgi:aromatic ring-cleaving dioxygenase